MAEGGHSRWQPPESVSVSGGCWHCSAIVGPPRCPQKTSSYLLFPLQTNDSPPPSLLAGDDTSIFTEEIKSPVQEAVHALPPSPSPPASLHLPPGVLAGFSPTRVQGTHPLSLQQVPLPCLKLLLFSPYWIISINKFKRTCLVFQGKVTFFIPHPPHLPSLAAPPVTTTLDSSALSPSQLSPHLSRPPPGL